MQLPEPEQSASRVCQSGQTRILDCEPSRQRFLDDVLAGLRAKPRSLPCKYFYDERGSQLFEQICELDEYYLTRTELEIIQHHAREMTDSIGSGVMLIEYGSGSSLKTKLLLDHLSRPAAYVPVDISYEHLRRTAEELRKSYPHIEILPVCADFTAEFHVPVSRSQPTHRAVYFPGSTIGNFAPQQAVRLLSRIRSLCGTGGGLLIGIDLQKQPETLEAAYNDNKGITAEFNRNLLRRINRELDADFVIELFRHRAVYNATLGRIEISLVSQGPQAVTVGETSFELADGEAICTEHSYKYTIDGFAGLAADAGLRLRRRWTDEENLFAVLHFTVTDS